MAVLTETPMVDLGSGVCAQVRKIDGVPAGVYYEHTCRGVAGWGGWVPLAPGEPEGWDLVSEQPLTVSPSLLCRGCGHHGFIRDGKWEPV